MALTNVLVQQNIANEGQPRALLVDAQGNPIISDTKQSDISKSDNEEVARETSFNIARMVELLQVIADNVKGSGLMKNEEDKDLKPSGLGEMLGFYGSMLLFSLFNGIFKILGGSLRFIVARILPFLAGGLVKIVGGLFTFLAGLPAGLAAAVIAGITTVVAGLIRGFKDAFKAYKDGSSFFEIVGAFVEGFFKGALNFVFDVIDWVANIFGIDLPDNLGDKIIDAIKDLFTSIVDYIKKIPSRIGEALKQALVPKGGTIDTLTGGYFTTTKTVATDTTDKAVSNTTFKMPEGNKTGITNDLSGVTAPIPKVESKTSAIPKPITGTPAPTFKKKMTMDEAKQIYENMSQDKKDEAVARMSLLATEARTDATGELTDEQIEAEISKGATKEETEAFMKVNKSSVEYIKDLNTKINVGMGRIKYPLDKKLQDFGVGSEGKPTYSSITPNSKSTSDAGSQIMTSSAAIEDAKSSASSAPVVINAPSSTVNSPKETNLLSNMSVRNSENTVSKYVDSLHGVNL